MVNVGIVGGTGYTGVELLRLLAKHEHVSLKVITSRSEAGTAVADMFPSLRHHIDLLFTDLDIGALKECDVVFFATPNGVAMQLAPELIKHGVRVIDLAADFRLKDPSAWHAWYGTPHACPELLDEAVYGLAEVNRCEIAAARVVANPGCYPTAVQLGLIPLLEAGLISSADLIADTKSGVSGAGRKENIGTLLCEASESLKAYSVSGHRHMPEIVQGLQGVCSSPVNLTFVPHLTPMIRGIHATIYATRLAGDAALYQDVFQQRYANEPFVDVLPAGAHPETRSVRGSNMCRIAVHLPQNGDKIVVLSVIDNLVKGAAGQAVQNMNIMLGIPEKTGLTDIALLP